MIGEPLRVVIIDDSVVYRKIVRRVLSNAPNVEIVGVAPDGQLALEVIEVMQPDLITLDVEMPILDGLGVLRELKRRSQKVAVIMISCLTAPGAELTTQALELGAFDFVLKPDHRTPTENIEQLRRDLMPKIEALAMHRNPPRKRAPVTVRPPTQAHRRPAEIVVIGVSTGGPEALAKLLPALPAEFPLPIVIVQHMPPMFTNTLARRLNATCALQVQEAEHDQMVEAGNIYIAPGGKQLKLLRSPKGARMCVNDDPPINSCRPSVDYLFCSAAEIYGDQAIGVILTGMGNDGTNGCQALKKQNSLVIAQDESSCVIYGMPRCVVEAGLADEEIPLQGIAASLQTHARSLQCK